MRRIPAPPNHWATMQERAVELQAAWTDPRYAHAVRLSETKYRHWDKVRYVARAEGLEPEVLWTMIKFARLANRRTLPFADSLGVHLNYTIPDSILQELMMIDRQLAGHITFEDESAITESHRDRFIVSALMEEAIASSQLEGASTVHRVAKEMLRRNRAPRDRSERMIANNYRAILFVRDQRRTPMSIDMLVELQRILTEGTLDRPDQSGRLRRDDDHVVVEDQFGEELHVPPPASSLPDRLQRLCEFANQQAERTEPFVHPVIRAMALHFQLGYDHPFCDGNGRTARTLFYWHMLRAGYWPFEFLPISRLICQSPARYGVAFRYVETDEFDLTYFLVYHARIIRCAREDLVAYLARKRGEISWARAAFGSLEINDRQRSVLMETVERSRADFTIEAHQVRHGISYFTARADLLGLESLGYLEKRREGKKFLFFPTARVREEARVDH